MQTLTVLQMADHTKDSQETQLGTNEAYSKLKLHILFIFFDNNVFFLWNSTIVL